MDFTSFVPECDELGYESERWGVLSVMTDDELHEWAGLEVLEDRACFPFVKYTVSQRDTGKHFWTYIDHRGMDEDDIWRLIAGFLDLHDFEQEVA